jgi:oligoendopeptidase F
VDDVRRSRPYNLPKDIERALSVRSPFSGKGPVVEVTPPLTVTHTPLVVWFLRDDAIPGAAQFYSKELSYLQFDFEGESVNLEVILSKMGVSTDSAYRRNAMKVVNDGLKKFENTAALSLNMVRAGGLSLLGSCVSQPPPTSVDVSAPVGQVAGSWHVENAERGFKNLRSQRNLGNNVPDEVVDSLLEAVRTTGVEQCKKYYTLKRAVLKATQGESPSPPPSAPYRAPLCAHRGLSLPPPRSAGLETFTWADRNAPIDIGTASESYSWAEAVEMVRAGYEQFSPTMATLFTQMVEQKRIDVPAENGKRGGAYCASAFGCGPFQVSAPTTPTPTPMCRCSEVVER